MTLTEEQFEQEYDKKYFKGKLQELEKILETKPTNLLENLGYMTILQERDRMKKETRKAEHLYAYMIKRPNYSPNDSRLEPRDKKVFIKTSCQINEGYILHRVFELEDALFTNSLDEADIGVYAGKYICDYENRNIDEAGNPAIWPLLYAVKNRDLPLVVITIGSLYFGYCSGKCPEAKFMLDLIGQKKNINHLPLGYPYNNASPLI